MTPTRIVADILLGSILVALMTLSLLRELAAWYEHRPYKRDTKRAAAIRQHSLLQMPDRESERLWEGD